ncbi:MAG: hypothetical protein QG608_3026 [Actinomycetota bacterium]|nr:hypothetical protein [Actinomycetota bacterium]
MVSCEEHPEQPSDGSVPNPPVPNGAEGRIDRPTQLDRALRELVDSGVVSPAQYRAMSRAASLVPGRHEAWISEALGYVGGLLVIAGLGAVLALSWGHHGRGFWAGVAGVVALVLFATGQVLIGGPEPLRKGTRVLASGARRRVAGVLLALAAVGATICLSVVLGEDPGQEQYWLPFALGTVVAAAGHACLRTFPTMLACTALSLLSVLNTNSQFEDLTTAVPLTGFAVLSLGGLWMFLGRSGVLRQRDPALGLGAAIALLGGQHCLSRQEWRWWAYLLTAAVALGTLILYRVERAGVLLVVGIAGLSIVIPELVLELTDGLRAAALVLLFLGAGLLTAAGLGLRRRRDVG